MDQARKSSVKRSHIKTEDEENSDQTTTISERREATTSSMASPSDKKKTRFDDDDDNEMEDDGGGGGGGEYDMYDEMEVDDDRGGPYYGGGGFDYGESDYDMMSLMGDLSMMRRFGRGGRDDFFGRGGSHWKKSRDMVPKKKINIGPILALNETQWPNFCRLL